MSILRGLLSTFAGLGLGVEMKVLMPKKATSRLCRIRVWTVNIVYINREGASMYDG